MVYNYAKVVAKNAATFVYTKVRGTDIRRSLFLKWDGPRRALFKANSGKGATIAHEHRTDGSQSV